MSANKGKLGSVKARTKDAATTMTGEATTEVTTTRFQITNAAHRYIDKTSAITVKVGGTTQTTGYSIEYAGGFVVFDSSKTGLVVTVDGKWWTMATIAQLYNWELDVKPTTVDCSVFGDTFKSYVHCGNDVSGSAKGYWLTADYYRMDDTSNSAGVSLPVVFYPNATQFYEGLFYVDGLKLDVPINSIIKSDLTFKGDGDLYFRP